MRAPRGPARQRGLVAMVVAVIVLLATLLAALSLMRSADTNSLIVGAIGFKQAVLQEAERAYRPALGSIPAGVGAEANVATTYFASLQPADARRKDLPAALVTETPTIGTSLSNPATGNSVRYVVERLCSAAGPASLGNCVVPELYALGGTNDETGSQMSLNGVRPAYRITVRVDGPRRAQAFVQTVIR